MTKLDTAEKEARHENRAKGLKLACLPFGNLDFFCPIVSSWTPKKETHLYLPLSNFASSYVFVSEWYVLFIKFNLVCDWSLISAKIKRAGEIHVSCETQRTRATREIFCAPRVVRVLRVLSHACISHALLIFAEINDYF